MRSNSLLAGLVILASALTIQMGRAAGIRVERHVDGYTCMMLNQSSQEAINPKFSVPVYAEPNEAALIVGTAMPVVAVKTPVQPINGFLPTLFPNGNTVWIPAFQLRPYRSLGDPAARCAPAIMSNGRPGFDYFH